MEIVVAPCKFPPFTTPSKHELITESSIRQFKPLTTSKHTNRHLAVSSKPDSEIIDSKLNYLCYRHRLSEAVVVLDSIGQFGIKVNSDTFARLLQTCIDLNSLSLGREFHKRMSLVRHAKPFIQTKLVSMYAKCGSLEDARKVFDEMRERDLFTWSAMIGACSRQGRWREVLDLFFSMVEYGVLPDNFLFPKILKACGNCGDVEICKIIHSMAIRCGMSTETIVNNSILAVYSKCSVLDYARKLFDKMEVKDTISWNSVITAYCRKGDVKEMHRLFELMLKEGIVPDLRTWNLMIASYNQLGLCDFAMGIMKEMKDSSLKPDVFTWTSMISGLSQNNRLIEALELFLEMLLEGIEPSDVTISSALSACASLEDLKTGIQLHSIALKRGFSESLVVGNSAIEIYSKCRDLEAARIVFDMALKKDAYTWNSMIAGYCQAGYCGKAYDLFQKMKESDLPPNVITWNAMITGYMQKGAEDQALNLFDTMEKDGKVKRDTASWNALIAGNLQNGHKNQALDIFRQMQSLNYRPNSVTLLSILPAFANLISAKKVKEIHACALRRNLEFEVSVSNSLIDTYSKSGNIVYSKRVFDEMPRRDIISWNTLIAGFVLHCCPYEALNLFDKMKEMSIDPNKGTFAGIIYAHSLAKLYEEGKRIFSIMIEEYCISPSLDHCAAMIDLYSRSGTLEEAIYFIEDFVIKHDFSIWSKFLNACRIRGKFKLAAFAEEKILDLQPEISKESLSVKNYDRKENQENVGQSWVEVNNRVYTFVSGDKSYPNAESVYSRIRNMAERMKEFDSSEMFRNEEEEDEKICGVHSENLALAFSLIEYSSHANKPIRIVKNLRMCKDCHFTAKVVSKAYGCDIYLSDSSCLHHFKNGSCSCGDYW